jgi:hypothetical protein
MREKSSQACWSGPCRESMRRLRPLVFCEELLGGRKGLWRVLNREIER